jgi:hypothetical protein
MRSCEGLYREGWDIVRVSKGCGHDLTRKRDRSSSLFFALLRSLRGKQSPVCYAVPGITIRVSRVCVLVLLHVPTAVQRSVQVEEAGVLLALGVAPALGHNRRRDTSKGTGEGLEVVSVGPRYYCCCGCGHNRLGAVGGSRRWGFSDCHSDRTNAFCSGLTSHCNIRIGSSLVSDSDSDFGILYTTSGRLSTMREDCHVLNGFMAQSFLRRAN